MPLQTTRYLRSTLNLATRVSASSTYPIICNGNPSYSGASAAWQDEQRPLFHVVVPGWLR
jgi:hypothetical protein